MAADIDDKKNDNNHTIPSLPFHSYACFVNVCWHCICIWHCICSDLPGVIYHTKKWWAPYDHEAKSKPLFYISVNILAPFVRG